MSHSEVCKAASKSTFLHINYVHIPGAGYGFLDLDGSCSFLKQQGKLQRMPNLSACGKVQTMLNCFTAEWISGNVSELKTRSAQ